MKPPTLIKETGETNLDRIGVGWSIQPNGFSVLLPHWVYAILPAMLAVIPWVWPKRFSLRTLLIATTLVAVVLGLIVWLRLPLVAGFFMRGRMAGVINQNKKYFLVLIAGIVVGASLVCAYLWVLTFCHYESQLCDSA